MCQAADGDEPSVTSQRWPEMVGSHWEPEKGLAGCPFGLGDLLCPFSDFSSAPTTPDHVAVGYGPRLSVMLSLDTDNTTTLVLVHGFSLHPLSFSGAKARF